MKRFTSLSKWAILPLSLASCSLQTPDLKACSVAGVLRAGATCTTTNSKQRSRITLEQLVELLEPRPEREIVDPKDPAKKIKIPAKAAAVILPAESWTANRTFYEQACRKLGEGVCNAEIKKKVGAITESVDTIQAEAMELKISAEK